MVSKNTVLLVVFAALGWLMALAMFIDNRALASLAFVHESRNVGWVKPETVSQLATGCEQLAHVNKMDQEVLKRAKMVLEEIDVTRQINEERLIPRPPRKKRRGRHDKVRSVSRRVDEGSSGVGGPDRRSSTHPP